LSVELEDKFFKLEIKLSTLVKNKEKGREGKRKGMIL
jgi:hypothetical protein